MPDEAEDPRFGIARNMQRLMDDRDVSTEELVERSEISTVRIEGFLSARTEPTARDLLRLATVLGVTIEELLGGIGEDPAKD